MFATTKLGFYALLLSSSSYVVGREQWLERNGRAVILHPRRFGQEQPAVIQKLSGACAGQICGVLAGEAVTPLLAAQPECSQQDHADKIIDAAQALDAATKANLIALAIEYRQAEKNTPPDFSTNPPTLRNSVFCQKAPKNPELNGLVQAQDPNNDPDLFFDPATKATVKKGTQANTAPFGGVAAADPVDNAGDGAAAGNDGAAASSSAAAEETAASTSAAAATSCAATVTVTASGAAVEAPTGAATVSVGAPEATGAPVDTGAIGDFGKCSVPQIEFGVGFDNRRETSFRPVDLASFPHGSAQNIDIITRAVCDQLVNTCGADDTAKATCARATAAASAQTAKRGIQADAFNAEFGIDTNFGAITAVDDQGKEIAGSAVGTPDDNTGADDGADDGADTGAGTGDNTADDGADDATPPATGDAGAIGNFGKCSVPEIEFGVGFDNRKETSFRPVDLVSYPHGSAQNGAIITQFVCDQLVNSCGADATAQATCAKAEAEFLKGAAKTGEQADLFNAVFGKQTNFAGVDVVDNQGNVVQAGAGNGGSNNGGANNNGGGAASTTAAAATTSAAATAAPPAATAVAGNLQKFAGNLGGVAAPTVTALANGQFQVEGNAAFNNLQSALVRSCDVQNNKCANAANASGNKNGLNVGACNAQQATCIAQAKA
jgi:hypothetical protein